MSFAINKEEPARPAGAVVADRRLWLTADKSKAVEDGDKQAAFLLATPGTEIPGAQVAQLGLTVKDGCIVLPSKQAAASPPPQNPTPPPGDTPPAPAKAKAKRAKKGG